MRLIHRQARRGAIVPLVALSLVAVLGLVALAIDIGMVAVAKTQAQNAADVAAMVGTRTFNQQSGYNLTEVPKNAVKAAVANKIFNTAISGDPASITTVSTDSYKSGAVSIVAGGYYYVYNDSNPSSEGFQMVIPGKSGTEPYTAVRATIDTTSQRFFGNVFGATPFTIKATAVAAHRPRDVVIVMDMSGSMRFQSQPAAYTENGYMYPHWGPRNVSLNPDPDFPVFGHYAATDGSGKYLAALQGTTSGSTGNEVVDPSNYVYNYSLSGPPVVDNIMSSGSTKAFTAAAISKKTTPGGDNYIKVGSNYAQTLTDIFTTSSPTVAQQLEWARNGYTSSTYNSGVTTFNGYTEGPNYWGKTFFIWPPDPRGSDLDANTAANHANNGAKDWRQRFFFKQKTSDNTLYWCDQNTMLYDTAGSPATVHNSGVTPIKKLPQTTTTVTENGVSVTYRLLINYAAIFHWLRNQSPAPFPTSMTTGRISYYSAMPDPSSDTGFNNRFWTQSPMTDRNERFWKDYIDYMLGYYETGANTYDNELSNNPISSYVGNGDYFAWGTVSLNDKPDPAGTIYTATVNNTGGYAAGTAVGTSLSFNNVKTTGGTAADLPGAVAITGATNATPIVVSSVNSLSQGNTIQIKAVGGNTNANGTFKVGSSPTGTSFKLTSYTNGTTNIAGNGSYTANTGMWIPAITAVSGSNPVTITTGASHGMVTGQSYVVSISSVKNGSNVEMISPSNTKLVATATSATQFTLSGATSSGTFSQANSTGQWWEAFYYVRFGNQSTFYEINDTNTTSGSLVGTNDIALTTAAANADPVKIYTTVPKYMNYSDNPYRPRHQMWFGAQTWLDWLGNYPVYQYPNSGGNANLYTLRWPGNTAEAQAWSCKVGISAAIDDIKNNHPNDFVALTFFSSPSYGTGGGGNYNTSAIPLGRNYQGMKDSLWFPPSTVTGTATSITPYDADFNNVPRAKGGTTPGMGFMLAYNLLSSSTSNLRTYATPTSTYRGLDGGLGRKGASRLIIFETDGAPNTRAIRTLAGTGADSYYPIRIKDPLNIANGSNEFPSGPNSYSDTEVYNVVKQICASTTASPPGYSTTRKPALVYSIGYGSMFDPANASKSNQADALDFLQTVQYHGGVAANSTGSNFPDWQRIYGDNTTRQTRLRNAIQSIMQSGVQVSLIE